MVFGDQEGSSLDQGGDTLKNSGGKDASFVSCTIFWIWCRRKKEIIVEIEVSSRVLTYPLLTSRVRQLIEKHQKVYPEFERKREKEVEETLSCFHFLLS